MSRLVDMPKLGTAAFWIWWSGFVAGLLQRDSQKRSAEMPNAQRVESDQ